MIPKECVENTKVSRVKVEERGRRAVFVNLERKGYQRTKFDGCVNVEGPRADWIISIDSVGDVVVELKGRDVEYGAIQVHATAEFLETNKLRSGRIAGLIVSKQFPKETASIQRKRNAFAKRFKGPLHVVTRNAEFYVERVLAFDGPD